MPHPRDKVRNAPLPRVEKPKPKGPPIIVRTKGAASTAPITPSGAFGKRLKSRRVRAERQHRDKLARAQERHEAGSGATKSTPETSREGAGGTEDPKS